MGSADIVPGVSGGTIAFILGVYEELIYSIKKVTGETLKLGLKLKIKEAIYSVPFSFLVPLGLGIVTAVLALSSILEHQLETNPVYVWSFFFGLIVASIIIVRRRVVTWDNHDIMALVIAAFVGFIIVGMVPVATPATLPLFFVAGMVAIVAMILPGVSGSFLLVMMGKYEQVLSAVNDHNFLVLGVIIAGAVVGIAVFSRFLSWLFDNHHDLAVSVLTGFMVGSLRKIWPWKEYGANILPSFNNEIALPLILMIIAAVGMLYLEKISATAEHTKDVEDPSFTKEHKKAISSQKHR